MIEKICPVDGHICNKRACISPKADCLKAIETIVDMVRLAVSEMGSDLLEEFQETADGLLDKVSRMYEVDLKIASEYANKLFDKGQPKA